MNKPIWILYSEKGEIVASVRADDSDEARKIFKEHGLSGHHMRRG